MDIRKLQRAIVDGLEDVKAQDIVVYNTEALSALFERVIIASGSSNRQTKALAASVRDKVHKELKSQGGQVLRMEGVENGEWIIVDCGQAVVHIMQPAIRQYYQLEEIWGGKPVAIKLGGGKRGLVKASTAPDVDEDEEDTPVARKKAPARKASAAVVPAKKAAAKKAAAKKAPAGKTPASKTTGRKPAARPVAELSPAREAAIQRPAARKAAKPAAAPAARKATAASRAYGELAMDFDAPAGKPAAKEIAAKKSVRRSPAEAAPMQVIEVRTTRAAAGKQPAAKKVVAAKRPVAKKAAAKTAAPARKVAAKTAAPAKKAPARKAAAAAAPEAKGRRR